MINNGSIKGPINIDAQKSSPLGLLQLVLQVEKFMMQPSIALNAIIFFNIIPILRSLEAFSILRIKSFQQSQKTADQSY